MKLTRAFIIGGVLVTAVASAAFAAGQISTVPSQSVNIKLSSNDENVVGLVNNLGSKVTVNSIGKVLQFPSPVAAHTVAPYSFSTSTLTSPVRVKYSSAHQASCSFTFSLIGQGTLNVIADGYSGCNVFPSPDGKLVLNINTAS